MDLDPLPLCSQCYYYCGTFANQLLKDWTWSLRYPGWKEDHRYMHFVEDRCDMWSSLQVMLTVLV